MTSKELYEKYKGRKAAKVPGGIEGIVCGYYETEPYLIISVTKGIGWHMLTRYDRVINNLGLTNGFNYATEHNILLEE